MEAETTEADEKIAKVRNDEDIGMLMLDTVVNASQSKVHKHEVGHRIDDFGGVPRSIVVLQYVSRNRRSCQGYAAYFFTPIDR